MTIQSALQRALSDFGATEAEWQTIKPIAFTPRAVLFAGLEVCKKCKARRHCFRCKCCRKEGK